ncbi:glutamyl-tRNA(Gln) amidotransferase subunit PET112 [Sporobolomyces salmoneus]|uniref:glutamyl-tRNA(Gln) amidotransferase subunit PET112 n=1 Tax=Sporobolomyces salmoneus TaxID=183962 RepID=UPI00317BDF40
MNRIPIRTCSCQLRSSSAKYSKRFASTSLSSNSSSTNKGKGKAKSKDRYSGWKPTIGVELHVQLKGNQKLFSKAISHHDALPNSHVAFLDASLPGALPVLEPNPVRLALLACLAFESEINLHSTFDRKHYFYPDQPMGYQITQKYSPLAKGGKIRIRTNRTEGFVDVRLDQVQLEQDTAKSFHDPSISGTLIDLNRSGTALIEIVTQPDLSSAEEAASFVKSLQAILRHVGASDANMERGELRCDVNVSVQRANDETIGSGTRCEVKNLNGVRFIAGAIESEISRQIDLLSRNEPVIQSTRGYDALTGKTFHLRSKEDAPDYRYFPDPELGQIAFTPEQLDQLRAELPELPDAAFERLQSQYSLSARDAGILVALGEGIESESEGDEGGAGEGSASIGVSYFERVAKGRESKVAANWVIHELLGQLTKNNLTLLNNPIDPEELGQLVDAVTENKLTGTNAKSLLRDYLASTTAPSSETSAPASFSSHLSTVLAASPPPPSATSFLPLLLEVIDSHPAEVEKIKKGQTKVVMRLVGEVMKRSGGKADAKWVRKEFEDRLK